MKFGIVVLPGSNCDHDALHVTRDLLGAETEVLWHKETDLKGVDCVVIPGGFAYGDYLRAGALAKFAPIMEPIRRHAAAGGLVFGICNRDRNVLGMMPHPERCAEALLGNADGFGLFKSIAALARV